MLDNISYINFERGNSAHKKAFADLNIEWLEKFFHVEDFDNLVFSNPEKHILDNEGTIIFALLDNQIVGTGCLFSHSDYYEIAKMGVNENYQGYGIGKNLLLKLIDIAKQKKLEKVYIVSNTKLEPAIKLYRRYGFKDTDKNFHSGYGRGNITLELSLI